MLFDCLPLGLHLNSDLSKLHAALTTTMDELTWAPAGD